MLWYTFSHGPTFDEQYPGCSLGRHLGYASDATFMAYLNVMGLLGKGSQGSVHAVLRAIVKEARGDDCVFSYKWSSNKDDGKKLSWIALHLGGEPGWTPDTQWQDGALCPPHHPAAPLYPDGSPGVSAPGAAPPPPLPPPLPS
jgi:hypothetical protein